MNERNRHRRLVIAAAGLAMSGALMVACGHARGERAMNTTAGESVATDSAMPTPSTANGAATSTSAATPVNPSGGNASASATTTTSTSTRHRARAASGDYSASAVPSDNTTTSTATTATRRHRRAAAETSASETASTTEPASTTPATASPNGAEANSGLTVSGANALPAGATCSPASGAVAITTQPSSDLSASATAQTDVSSAKPLSGDVTVSKPVPSDRADTAKPASSQPYDVNGSASAKPTPDTSGGSLGARDTSKVASGFGNTSVRASEPNPSSMIPSATASASINATASTPAVTATSEGGSLPPCGWPAGAKGGFLNDAQVTHAVLIANSVDSAAAAGILTRTQNPAVRDFAQMMLREHTDANHQLAAIIDRTHIAPAENDISSSILQDTTGHTFASAALSTQVMGQTVSPVRQPAAAPSANTAPKPRTEHVDTVAAPPLGGTGSNPAVKSSDAHVNTYDYNSTSSATANAATAPSSATTTTSPTAAAPTPLTGDDKNYIDYMVQAHQAVLDALDSRLIPFAWNPDLRSALEAMKPVVQRHLDRAREIQRGQTASNY